MSTWWCQSSHWARSPLTMTAQAQTFSFKSRSQAGHSARSAESLHPFLSGFLCGCHRGSAQAADRRGYVGIACQHPVSPCSKTRETWTTPPMSAGLNPVHWYQPKRIGQVEYIPPLYNRSRSSTSSMINRQAGQLSLQGFEQPHVALFAGISSWDSFIYHWPDSHLAIESTGVSS